MGFHSISREAINCATPVNCQKNLQKLVALDLGNVKQYLKKLQFVLRATRALFEPKQVQSAISRSTFSAQDARIYSNAGKPIFSNRHFFTKHSENILKRLMKALPLNSPATSEITQLTSFKVLV